MEKFRNLNLCLTHVTHFSSHSVRDVVTSDHRPVWGMWETVIRWEILDKKTKSFSICRRKLNTLSISDNNLGHGQWFSTGVPRYPWVSRNYVRCRQFMNFVLLLVVNCNQGCRQTVANEGCLEWKKAEKHWYRYWGNLLMPMPEFVKNIPFSSFSTKVLVFWKLHAFLHIPATFKQTV